LIINILRHDGRYRVGTISEGQVRYIIEKGEDNWQEGMGIIGKEEYGFMKVGNYSHRRKVTVRFCGEIGDLLDFFQCIDYTV